MKYKDIRETRIAKNGSVGLTHHIIQLVKQQWEIAAVLETNKNYEKLKTHIEECMYILFSIWTKYGLNIFDLASDRLGVSDENHSLQEKALDKLGSAHSSFYERKLSTSIWSITKHIDNMNTANARMIERHAQNLRHAITDSLICILSLSAHHEIKLNLL